MGTFGPIHWVILGVVVLLMFGGRGKLSGIMGDAATGIKAFRDGLKDDSHSPSTPAAPPQQLPPTVEREKDPVVR
jgi:sec-independent protein translocase protein TatA